MTAAGTDRCGALGDVPAAEWERVVAVNLFGTAAVIRAALPALKQSRGKIVTVASTLGLRALPDATRVLRLEVRGRRDDPRAGHRARRPGRA